MKNTRVCTQIVYSTCIFELSRYLCCAYTDFAIAATYHVINEVKAVYQFIFSFIRLCLLSSCIRAKNCFSWIVNLFIFEVHNGYSQNIYLCRTIRGHAEAHRLSFRRRNTVGIKWWRLVLLFSCFCEWSYNYNKWHFWIIRKWYKYNFYLIFLKVVVFMSVFSIFFVHCNKTVLRYQSIDIEKKYSDVKWQFFVYINGTVKYRMKMKNYDFRNQSNSQWVHSIGTI